MNKVSNKILLAMIAASLAACGGGGDDGGGDDFGDDFGGEAGVNQPGGSGTITGTPVDGSVQASSNAVFNLSGVVTLLEYDEVVEQEAVSTQSFSLSGLTTVTSSSSGTFTSLGASNLLGVNDNGDTIFPVANIESLFVDYSLLSPDQKKLYVAVSEADQYDYSNLASGIRVQRTDGAPGETEPLAQPLIGPAFESSVPLNYETLRELYPDGNYEVEFGPRNSDGTCSEGFQIDYLPDSCATGFLIEPSPAEDPIRIKVQDVLNTLQEDYFSCSLVEIDRQGGPIDCVGGTTVVDAEVVLFGERFPFKLKTAKFNRNGRFSSAGDLDAFEAIRPGLRPLQFDDAGNLYTLTSRYNSDVGYYFGSELTRITPAGDLEQVIGLDSRNVETFLTLSNGDVVAVVRNSNTGGTSINLIQGESLIPVVSGYQFKADTGSTFIIGGKLFKPLPAPQEGFTSIPIRYQTQDITNIYLTDEGELYGCYERPRETFSDERYADIVKVYPYQKSPVVPGDPGSYRCDFGSISFGYRAIEKTIPIGTLGSTDIISIVRLSDSAQYTVFEETDYNGKPRYSISNLAFGGNKIIFSADRTSPTIGTVLGEIDVSLLGKEGVTEDEYLKLSEVQSSIAASNTVRKITPLPFIEPTTTASGPKITSVYFDKSEYSHIGFEFSEFMNKDTVLESLSLKRDRLDGLDDDVEYIPFWGYKKLYLIADTNGLGDSNGDDKITEDDYQPYLSGEQYNIEFNIDIAKDVAGRTMSTRTEPNAVHSRTFQ